MYDNNNLEQNSENINNNLEIKIDMKKLQEELKRSYESYKKSLRYMAADMPISALCITQSTEKKLYALGYQRIYDLFDVDFTKIEGLNASELRNLTSRFNQFLSML